jgi:hypothetical protein
MNEEAAYVQDEEATQPKYDQHNRENEKHGNTCLLINKVGLSHG